MYEPRYSTPRPTKQQYRRITVRGHPLADSTGRMHLHRYLLYEAIGPGSHECYWCGKRIVWQKTKRGGAIPDDFLFPDHLDGDGLNNDIENIVPACGKCNGTRGNPTLVGDDEVFTLDHGWRTRAELRTCQNCGSRFPHPLSERRPDRGKYCSRPCTYAAQRKHG